MAVAPSTTVFRCLLSSLPSSPHSHNLPLTLPFHRTPLFRSLLLPSRHRTLLPALAAANNKNKSNKNKKKLLRDRGTRDNDENDEEDAFELLFKQLEEDLKKDNLLKDGSNDDDDDEITEEELALLDRELEGALGEFDAETLNPDLIHAETDAGDNEEEEEDDDDEGDEEDEEDSVPMLRTWQMKKLARALKAGRRKTSIKNLAADLCLDRAYVIELLRNPPPNLLMMSLSIPDEPTPKEISVETKPSEIVLEEKRTDPVEAGNKANLPVHVMQQKWSAQKRLKRAQVDTLEKVYRRSKRPTNAMISSIVHVTNIPRRRVVKWFEDKRAEEGVPENRVPYQRPVSETS